MRILGNQIGIFISLLLLSRLVVSQGFPTGTDLSAALSAISSTSDISTASPVTSSASSKASSVTSSASSTASSATSTDQSSLPACGQTCINNALAESVSFGCPLVNELINSTCLCPSADFGNAIRDCSEQTCPSGTDITSILSVADSYCLAAALSETFSASSSGIIPVSSTSTHASSTSQSTFSTVTGSGTSNPSSVTTNSAGAVTTIYVTGTPPPSSGGLSKGAKAGIGAGVPLGTIAILAVLGFIWFKRKKQRTAQDIVAENHQPQSNLDDEKPELQAVTASHISRMTKPELEGRSTVATSEMVTNANRHEMETPGVSASLRSPWSIDGRAELSGTAH